jgi:hypothetical protein
VEHVSGGKPQSCWTRSPTSSVRSCSHGQADGRAILLASWPLAEKGHCRGGPPQFGGNSRVFGLFVLRVDLTA